MVVRGRGLLGLHRQCPAITPILLTFLFFGSLILSGLGIVGLYIWRAYENTKRRPTTIVVTPGRLRGEAAQAEDESERS